MCKSILITFVSSMVVLYGSLDKWVKVECGMEISLNLAQYFYKPFFFLNHFRINILVLTNSSEVEVR